MVGIEDVTVKPITILIGYNGSGKTYWYDQFLYQAISQGKSEGFRYIDISIEDCRECLFNDFQDILDERKWGNIIREELLIKYLYLILKLKLEVKHQDGTTYIMGRNRLNQLISILDIGSGSEYPLSTLTLGLMCDRGECAYFDHPETWLHLSAQLELGSFLADIWTQLGVKMIIETHSENLILRLRKLVAKKQLNPDDINIAYFHQEEDGTVNVRNIGITEDGSYTLGLPMAFFGSDVVEALGIY